MKKALMYMLSLLKAKLAIYYYNEVRISYSFLIFFLFYLVDILYIIYKER